ncbi:MAG: DUF362 domain-containing protein [Spirochaetia bacterium]|jgi:uncharacterized protein (DUF362 family)/NAD-dependent dihydropyrimidine dehydrogenase PreA subunit|nr:DUF362 domain-containing protein [Spirochaetia bacterium]
MTDVAIVPCDSYEADKLKKAIELVIEKSDFPIVKGKKVLLKPNILSDSTPDRAITTNPAILRAMIELLIDKGAEKIVAGDSPSIQKKNSKPTACGLYQVCEEKGIEWIDFTQFPVKKKLPYVHHSIPMAAILDEVDVVIDLPKFKTHELMLMTGAVKNLFGTVPSLYKSAQHVHHPTRGSFAKMLCGIFSQAHVDYALMDGIIGMEGAGPANGKPRQIGLLLGGKDCVAIDVAASTIMGYDPLSIPTNAFALKNGLTGLRNLEDIHYPLLHPSDIMIKDFLRCGGKSLDSSDREENLRRQPPRFIADKCIRCGRCIEICPAKALELKDGHVGLTAQKCIRCYCCHEVCPAGAIEIEE